MIADTIPQLLVAAARRWPESTAIEDGETVLSFSELAGRCSEAARAFIAAGIEHGDRVAVWAPNIHEWIIAAAGAQSAGAVIVPLNTRLKGAEAGYIIAKSRARLLLTVAGFLGGDYLDMLEGALGGGGEGRPVAALPALERVVFLRGASRGDRKGVQTWASFIKEGDRVDESEAESRARAVSAGDTSDIMFTSGTTGKPKGAVTCHGQNLRAFESWTELVGLEAGDRYLIVNPFFHSFGYKAGWLSCLMRGATILPQAVFDVPEVLARIGRDRVTMLPGPPALYQTILAHPKRDAYDLSSLRLAVTGAAAIPVELIRRMRDQLGFDTVITGYGLTEACGIATMCRYDDDARTIATTSGRAIPDVEVLCVDGGGSEAKRGEPGEVVVRGYNIMQGYFDDDEATAEAIDGEGWLHTGDIGVMDQRGYLRITDRIKDMFIMGGFNCYPAEIENLMLANEEIVQVAVIGVPDERMGEVGMAWVVKADGSSLDADSLVSWCKDNMANYKVPRRTEFVDELPMNASGKVMKYLLRERAGG